MDTLNAAQQRGITVPLDLGKADGLVITSPEVPVAPGPPGSLRLMGINTQ